MTTDPNEYLRRALDFFDSLDLKKEYDRRQAIKPLYDYLQILVLEVAVRFCGQDKNGMKNQHLETRWNMIKTFLSIIEDPKRWDQFISQINNARSSAEHNDYYYPPMQALSASRKHIPEFTQWLLSVGRKYYEASKGFSFIQEYVLVSQWYIGQADWMIHQYGEKPPFADETDRAEHQYDMLKPLRERVNLRLAEIQSIDDLKKEDLKDLVQLVKGTERLDAREDALLRFNICPKCGGKMIETQREVGGSYDEPPSAIVYRVGCEKCDYELVSETIDV
jgi:uncharacterized protein YfkK (UPF0435 family)